MLSICPSGPLKAATCMVAGASVQPLALREDHEPVQVLLAHLAAVCIFDGAIKYCAQLQQPLDSGLQVFNLEAEER